ncbi:MAG: DUF3618 domain-containing protein [Stackebrandtia sp.]
MNATVNHTHGGTDAEQLPEPTPEDNPDVIRADIVVTRSQLGDTVEALASKMDMKSRMRDVARGGADTARRQWIPLTMVAAAVAVIGIGVAIGRRREDES